MKVASNERCERDQRESQTAAETSGSSAETTEDATVGDDRTTHEANTVAEEHSALQAENQNLLENAQSLQHASLRENDERHLAIKNRGLQAEREKKALEERVAGLSVIETEHRKLLDRAQGLNEAQERCAILLQQKDDELRTASREQKELARQILVEAEVKAQLERQLEDLKVTARQHETLQRQIPSMNKLEARNSSLHQVEMLKKALRTQQETINGGEPMLELQQRVDAMTAKDAKTQAEHQTRADVIRKLEKSNAALQQKRLAEGEWKVQDTYTANHMQTLVAQIEEE